MDPRKRKAAENNGSGDSSSVSKPFDAAALNLKRLKKKANVKANVNETDFVLLIAQFLKEMKYFETLQKLEEESKITFGVVEDKNKILECVRRKRWNVVLKELQNVSVSPELLAGIHEQIILDLCEQKEFDTAKSIFLKSSVLNFLKENYVERYKSLIFVIQQKTPVRPGRSAECDALATKLGNELTEAEPSELLRLVGDACKWKKLQDDWPLKGLISHKASQKAKSLREKMRAGGNPSDKPVEKVLNTIRFGASSYAEGVDFSSDGVTIATGSVDGFVELWNAKTGKLRTDLEFQKNQELLMHTEPVLCVAFNEDSSCLASGCQAGTIKIWKVQSGKCIKKMKRVHSKGVLSLCFSPGGDTVLSGGHDHMVKLHGLKSGNKLKEFRGHTSYVNSVCYLFDSQKKEAVSEAPCKNMNEFASASSDATVRIWNVVTNECLHIVTLPTRRPGDAISINRVVCLENGNLLLCDRSDTLCLLDRRNLKEVKQKYRCPNLEEFVSATYSVQGSVPYIYGATRERNIYCFNLDSGKLEKTIKIEEGREILGLEHNPLEKILAAYTRKGPLVLLG